jgi:hypothetical protein
MLPMDLSPRGNDDVDAYVRSVEPNQVKLVGHRIVLVPVLTGQNLFSLVPCCVCALSQDAFVDRGVRSRSNRLSRGSISAGTRGLSMSGNEEAKRDAEQQVSKELANQPKQDGPGKEESKDRRAHAEEKLTTPRRSE